MMRLSIAALAMLLGVCPGVAPAQPVAGDTFVYRVTNRYNNESRGQVTYRVEKVDAERVAVAVTTDTPLLGPARTEIYARDGNWLRHPLINHDQPTEHEFSPPYPAYAFPLETGKTWSVRVTGTHPASGERRSVRVDGEVLGSERITTPAGAFDTIKVRRRVYAGDWKPWKNETNITETDWFAPALGRPVRSERNSGYIDQIMVGIMNTYEPTRGDWQLFELVSHTRQ